MSIVKRETFLGRMAERLFGSEITRRVNLAVKALDDFRDRPAGSTQTPRDRRAYNRVEVQRDALEAWRNNPLARRIVSLTSQYVVGGGLSIESPNEETDRFLKRWWFHRLNRMPVRAFEWCDELTRSGELFIVIATDKAGMSYVRAIPALDIDEIETAANDVEQPIRFFPKASGAEWVAPKPYDAYDENMDARAEDGSFETVMLHYAINRPVGAKRGESDLAPILRWLTRYATWLEDRVRLNRFRQAFLWVVKGVYANAAERLARQAELNANPPNPGSILVTDRVNEEWDVVHPKLDSFEAEKDGLAIKKIIAAGSANPMHFLAEPEGATRTTAEQSGGPTYRHYEQRQLFFVWMLTDIAGIALKRRAMADHSVPVRAEIKFRAGDISGRDNAALAVAASTMIGSFVTLRDRGLIDDEELLRVSYKFAGEVVDVRRLLADARKAEPSGVLPKGAATPPPPGGNLTGKKQTTLDPETGEVDVKEPELAS